LERRFLMFEAQVYYISHNMAILMVALENKFRPSKEFGSCNSDIGSSKKFGDKEEP
jgi:hypothetical protein